LARRIQKRARKEKRTQMMMAWVRQVDSVISQINTWKQCWVEREVCREVYAPVPVTPEDTGNARRALQQRCWRLQPDVAASHVNIGNVLDDMGNPEEALVELKKGLDVLVSVTATSTGLGRLQV